MGSQDPSKQGCNPAMKSAGQALVGTAGILGLIACCFCWVVTGVGFANRIILENMFPKRIL